MLENWEALPAPVARPEQPLPTPGGESVTDALVALIRQREAKGITTYGDTLRTFNGRDALRDLLEEQLDGAQYTLQAIMERDNLHARLDWTERHARELMALREENRVLWVRVEAGEATIAAMRPVVDAALTWAVPYSYQTPAQWRAYAQKTVDEGRGNGAPYWEIAALMEAVEAYENQAKSAPVSAGESNHTDQEAEGQISAS